ncbi:MAG: hypothetical protein A2X28_10985 [Elusimicrobia bacterium GWA2_56_46]|nr:MAG: hypothetical protein A2X28_10985 [Elusimicrobia bacterium GWA2_56_46]OGR56254.1 MAG: hypothetical protein A2X39_10355 [Elusimicrobia bacterium GWC2_56_31]HBB66337.1 hypothetical protein [Elusimicrobiota bacterium]HBW22386.1 hypothetical protein [Elusimicrobiota bacterium]
MFEQTKAKVLVYAGIFLAFIGIGGNWLGIEPFHTLFYIFAWWAYIFIVDAAVYRIKGDSLIVSRKDEFWFLAAWSVFIWFLFELANLRLQNWQYMFLPSNRSLRWTGYFLAYATVLPGLFETTELVAAAGLFRNAKSRPFNVTPGLLKKIYIAGAAALLLPLTLPKYFFALIWAAFTLLLEPVNYRLGFRSLLRDLGEGRPGKIYQLLTGGFICGFLWELWNFKAGAKWVYTVPLVGNLKLFEMPVAGYIGFPLFALECYAMYNLISYLRRGKTWEQDAQDPLPGPAPALWLSVAAAALLAAVYYITPNAIDTHTVKIYIANL